MQEVNIFSDKEVANRWCHEGEKQNHTLLKKNMPIQIVHYVLHLMNVYSL